MQNADRMGVMKKSEVKEPCGTNMNARKIDLEGRTVVVLQCPKCKEVIIRWIPTTKSKKFARTEVRLTEEGAHATAQLLCEVLSETAK